MLKFLRMLFGLDSLDDDVEPKGPHAYVREPHMRPDDAPVGAPPPVAVSPTPSPSPPMTPPVARTASIGPTIAVVNMTSVVSDTQMYAAVAAMQIQIDRDFAPVWNSGANLIAIPTGSTAPPGTWIMYLMDTTDQAGALGYHDLTAEGNPLGKVFCKDDLKYGLSWTVTLSHEIVEALADPYLTNVVFVQTNNNTGTLYAIEIADPVEDDQFGYLINNVLVSDFVYPTWFESFRPANSTQFDHQSVLKAPLALAHGGYIGVFAVNATTTGWTQRLAEAVPGRRLARKTAISRTNRRGEKLIK